MQKTMPDNSPLIANTLVCSQCGDKIEPQIAKNTRGIVETLWYEHRNEEVGCSYRFEVKVYAAVEMRPWRKDGTEAKL